MSTIGRSVGSRSPRGKVPTRCDYCGIPWPRNRLTRDGAGLLRCPDDRSGADVVTLSKFEAQARRRVNVPTEANGAYAFPPHGPYEEDP